MHKHTDQEYIAADPFVGDEADITCRTVKIKTARKQHKCFGMTGQQDHFINIGDRYRHEKALVDNSFFGEYKICLKCIDDFMSDCGYD